MAHEEAILLIHPLMLKQQEDTINREKGRLQAFIRSRVDSHEEAEDILQDVFLQFLKGSGTLGSIENATSWLFRVARNKIIDNYRYKDVRGEHVRLGEYQRDDPEAPLMLDDILPDLGQTPEEMDFAEVIWDAVNEALEELPREQRDVFIGHELEEMNFKEMSGKWGIPVNTLISRKRYAVLALRKKLENVYNEM